MGAGVSTNDWKAELRRRIEVIREKKEAELDLRHGSGSAAVAPAAAPLTTEEPSNPAPQHYTRRETVRPRPEKKRLHLATEPEIRHRKPELKRETRLEEPEEMVPEPPAEEADMGEEEEPTLFPVESVQVKEIEDRLAASEGREQSEEEPAAPAASDLEAAIDSYTPLDHNPVMEESRQEAAAKPAIPKVEQDAPAIPHELNLRRMLAAVVDAIVLILSEALMLTVAGALLERSPLDLIAGSLVPLALLFGCLHFLYYVIFNSATGQTPGKLLLRLRITGKGESTRMGIAWAVVRWAAMVVSILPLAAGFFWIYSKPYGATWHDIALGMKVRKV